MQQRPPQPAGDVPPPRAAPRTPEARFGAAEASRAEAPQHHDVVLRVKEAIGRVIVGQQDLVDRLLVALLTSNHALIEGVPGLAKTLTVSTFAHALDCTFARVQFTPDLLPADITGTLVFNPGSSDFTVRRGPLFANVVLADEINRAPAKVQSALLEAMQERQVTIGGESYPLPAPFMVLATQNPIEQEGTYPLPEAQLDRFMLKIEVSYPSREEEREILRRALDGGEPGSGVATSGAEVADLQREAAQVEINDRLREYVVRLVEASRDPERFRLEGLRPLIEFGASPRAGVFLARAAQAYAYVHGRMYVLPEDVKALAPDVLRHRVVITYEADARGITADEVVSRLLDGVGIP